TIKVLGYLPSTHGSSGVPFASFFGAAPLLFDLILAFDKSTWDAGRINYQSFEFLNSKDLPKSKGAAPKNDAKGTPEDPWVEGK
ncbi:MAG: hypothetical protein K6F57_00195, partial [Candidatus Saccharibacteria bacterium]|nr:hypothetical protein [Candidatus Saccharibacteria bacterium]